MNNYLQQALEYASQGWSVFPLKPRGKIPASSAATYKHATTDPDKIKTWWELIPNANIAIQPHLSGLIVLDVDGKNGGFDSLEELENNYGPITTRKVITGSGGIHFYFKAPEQLITNKLGFKSGLDIISNVNHVVAPPSEHSSGGIYRWDNPTADIEECPRWLLNMIRPTQSNGSSIQLVPDGYNGQLSRLTKDFLENGSEDGTWNRRLFKAAKDFYEQGRTQEQFIAEAEKITGHLDSQDMSTINSAFRIEPKYAPRVKSDIVVRETVLRCHMITSMADPNHNIFVDLAMGQAYPNIHHSILKRVLNKDEFNSYMKQNNILADFIYNPHGDGPLHIDQHTDFYQYNTYIPPVWKSDKFYQRGEVPNEKNIPEIYQQFITHLCDNDIDSYNYVLDWLANSLISRNLTLLTAIGDQGIGKGTLGLVMEILHGSTNYVKVRDTIFKEKFNSALKNKTLVHVDEIELKNKEAIDRLKDIVNDKIEVEAKGVDSEMVKNYASFYLNSNSYDAVKIEAGDRRFSIIQLTSKKLHETPIQINELLKSENINKLANYLVNRKIQNNLYIPFKSKRYEEVKEAGLAEWENWVLEEFCPANEGQEIPISEFQEKMKNVLNMRHVPGRIKIDELARKYPEVIKVIKPKGERRVIKIIQRTDTPPLEKRRGPNVES